jgi:hypothetical protein
MTQLSIGVEMNAFSRLMAIAPDSIEDWEVEMFARRCNALAEGGWTEDEIVGHLKWTEHINADISEERGLKMLRNTANAVHNRLAMKRNAGGRV